MRKTLVLIAGAAAALLAGCGRQQATGVLDSSTSQVTSVTVSSRTGGTTLAVGETISLAATVTGRDNFDSSVNWSLTQGTGDLTADNLDATFRPSAVGIAKVQATSRADAAKYATVTLTVVAKPQAEDPPVQQPVINPTGVSIKSISDVNGYPFPMLKELNVSKDADLVAAQYEDSMCLQVLVKGAQQIIVPNAIVKVQASALNNVSISPGCVNSTVRPLSTETVRTDANGVARFTIFAPSPSVLNQLASNLVTEPIKFVISAASADGQVAVEPAEFKAFYLNMSHLFAGGLESGKLDSTQRWGHDFGVIKNVFEWQRIGVTRDLWNRHEFDTVAYQKQPQAGPYGFMPINGNVSAKISGSFFGNNFPGYMRYRILDATNVQFVAGCETTTTDGLGQVCIDRNSSEVVIQPRANVDPSMLPLAATVSATYVAQFKYGSSVYEFELKNYTFTKSWVGSIASITKSVDNHVLTWAGPDYQISEPQDLTTLAATNASTVTKANQDVFTTTVRIHVTNTGNAPLYRLTVRDALPAELGVLTDGNGMLTSNGFTGSYDAVNHAITWSWEANHAITALAAGASIDISFKTYARQKPGYCWDTRAASTAFYVVKPGGVMTTAFMTTPFTGCAYADPYLVINGREKDDVTVSYYMTDDFTSGTKLGNQNIANQQLRDYVPTQANESDIWVVRPLFTIDKALRNPTNVVFQPGNAAYFDITASQIDRTAAGSAYAQLRAWYPNEFRNGNGRLNPYGVGFRLEDHFDSWLDKTDATVLTVTPGLGPVNSYPVVLGGPDKTVRWNIPAYQVFAATDVGKTSLVLNINGSFNQTTALTNCAFFNANNLNQSPLMLPSSYVTNPWTQDEGISPWFPDLPAASGTWTAGTWIYDCAQVWVRPSSGSAIVGYSGRHEFTNLGPDLLGLTDPYRVGVNFAYKFDTLNVGPDLATGAKFEFIKPAGGKVILVPGAKVYTSTDGGVTFLLSNITFVTQEQTHVVSSNFDMTPNVLYRIVVPAQAIGVGQQDSILSTLTVASTGQTMTADDSTTIVP